MTAGDACTVAGAVTGAVTAGVTAGAIGTAGGDFKPRDLASTNVRFRVKSGHSGKSARRPLYPGSGDYGRRIGLHPPPRAHQSTDRECTGAMAAQAHLLIAGVVVCVFRLRFYQSRQAPFKWRRPRVETCCACWLLLPTPRLSAAPDVASDCSYRRRPNTPTRATCVTAGNAGRAAVLLRLPFPLASSGDGVGPTSNDL